MPNYYSTCTIPFLFLFQRETSCFSETLSCPEKKENTSSRSHFSLVHCFSKLTLKFWRLNGAEVCRQTFLLPTGAGWKTNMQAKLLLCNWPGSPISTLYKALQYPQKHQKTHWITKEQENLPLHNSERRILISLLHFAIAYSFFHRNFLFIYSYHPQTKESSSLRHLALW